MNVVNSLSEAMTRYGLSAEQAARYVGCSGAQIRRWIARRYLPTPIYAQAIMQGIHKMKSELAVADGSWRRQPEEDPAEDDTFKVEMKRIFEELGQRLSAEEKYEVFAANPDYWNGFVRYLALIRKYKIDLPI
jgi:hypothetical protein